MKKIISLLLSLAMLLTITSGLNLTAYAETGKCGENVTYSLDTSTGELTISGKGTMANYFSNNSPFYYNSDIKTITISSGVTSIGDYEFYGCTSLTSITIPDSVTSIGDYAFYGCTSLTSVTIPDSVTSIGEDAFRDCTSLTSITIPNSVTSIGQFAFWGCTSLTSITVDENNNEFSSVDFVLFNKTQTELIQYPIGNKRTNYNIPNSVTSIGVWAFGNSTSLTSISIPDSVTSIGVCAFECCTSLTSVTIPDSVTSIGNSAFSGCTSLTSVTIGNSVTSIGEYAFSGCASLTSVTIPDSVKSIGYLAFSSCDNLKNITVNSNNNNYSSQDGVLFNKNKTTLIQYPIGNTRTSYTIPDSVTSIGDYAFYYCKKLTSITIPDSVTSIGSSAFCYCTSLSSVTIPDSVTSIGKSAFYGCSLENVVIGNGVTSLNGFDFDENLKSITIGNGVTSIGDCAFDGCSSLTSVTIGNSVTSIGDDAFQYCTSLTSITLPDGVTSIGDDAFYNCTRLTSITIPDSVTSIGGGAFSYCKNLTSVTIPNSVTSIGSSAFYGCTSLTSVTIPDSVTNIGNNAFYGCTSLKSITIPNSVTSIGNEAFSGCTSLKDVYYTGSQSDWEKISVGDYNHYLKNATIHYNWNGEFPLFTNEDETSFTVYNSTAIIDSVNDVNLKLKSVNMNIAENSSQFDKKKVVKKNDIKGKEIKFTKDDFRDYIIPAKVTSDSKYLKSNSHNIYMTKDRKDGKPYVSSVYVQQLDKKNKPKKAYVDAQYDGATLIDGVNYNLIISAVTNGAKDVKYYLIQNDGNSKYKTEITNGVASKIDLASKMEDGKSLYAYVVCDGVASEPVSLKLEKKKLSNSLKNLMSSSTVNVLGGQSGKFKLSDSVPIIGGTEASLDFMKCPVGVEITGNKVKISVGLDLFGNTESTGNNGKTKSDWIKFKDNCKSFQETSKDHNDTLKKLKKFKKNYGSNKKGTFKTDFLGYLEGYITDTGSIEFTEVCGTVAAEFAYKIKVSLDLLVYRFSMLM